jgi:hypothetical protein
MDEKTRKEFERKKALEELVQLDLQDTRIRAMEPPMLLVDMRRIAHGIVAETENQVKMQTLYKTEYAMFLTQWRAAEREYRVCLRDLEEKWGKEGMGVDKVDGGYERLKKLLGDSNESGNSGEPEA